MPFAVAAACVVVLAVPASGQAMAPTCLMSTGQTASVPPAPLRFGIYPGGSAGSFSSKSPPRPEDPAKRLASVKALAGDHPFVVRLYSAWTGVPRADHVSGWLDREIAGYTAAGLNVELVVRYKPAATVSRAAAPSAFAVHVRAIVHRYGHDPRFVSLQVTNEANIAGAPAAADGAFAGAVRAVVKGVVSAKDAARRGHHDQLSIGFSWGYDERRQASDRFWAKLRRLGGRAFPAAVDWVGLDTYPGTWAPQLAPSDLFAQDAAAAVKESVRALRDCYMPVARLGNATAIHIAENGFPTGAGRSEALQSQTLVAMVRSVDAIRTTFGVTDYRWFDLRDSDTSDPSIESRYGITHDDYSPKPAYSAYRNVITEATTEPNQGVVVTAARCRPSRVKAAVPALDGRRLASLILRVGTEVVGRMRRGPLPRAVRISMRPGRSVVRLKSSTKVRGRNVTRVSRRTYRVC
jgi:hypothetical protein